MKEKKRASENLKENPKEIKTLEKEEKTSEKKETSEGISLSEEKSAETSSKQQNFKTEKQTTEEQTKEELSQNTKEKQPLSKKKKIIRTILVCVAIALIVLLVYGILVWTGAWEYINSVDKIRQLILSMGFWGRFTFVLLQFLQVTLLPIPSTISTLAGVLIYGPLQTALLSLAGVVLGSVFAFWLGRVFGRKVVVFMVGQETCDKWTKFLTGAKYSFFIMMLLPMFPDDVLCLVAGLTNMSWTFFVVTNLIARPIGIFMTCYLGSGSIIPYHGWGLVAWAFIIILVIVLIYLSYRYRTQIENFMMKHFHSNGEKTEKKSKKRKTNATKQNENVNEVSEAEKKTTLSDENLSNKKGRQAEVEVLKSDKSGKSNLKENTQSTAQKVEEKKVAETKSKDTKNLKPAKNSLKKETKE